MYSTPQLKLPAVWNGLVLRFPGGPWMRDKKARIRCLDRLTEWSFWNPSGSDRRDPNTLAPNKSKLGRLHRARQGLVRVPESNTKYGGKRGKLGGAGCLRCRQVSVSPQGFPSEKNLHAGPGSTFAPLFTGQLFIVAEGLPRRDSREATAMSGLACPPADSLAPR